MELPAELKYTADHEWVRLEGDRVRVGITDFAQHELGDIVFIEAPELGAVVTSGEKMSEVESTKSVSDIFAPVAGTVVEVNESLSDRPEVVNSDPYGEGWICVIEPASPSFADELLDAASYRQLSEG